MSVQILKKFTPALKEVRLHLCSKTASSAAARQFIDKYYLGIKKENPELPILVRECSGIEPRIWFRFEFGRETNTSLANKSPDQIAELFKDKVVN
jgi:NADH dehydrogenase (ubiquinone) 1 alpha subcomplex subunit 2